MQQWSLWLHTPCQHQWLWPCWPCWPQWHQRPHWTILISLIGISSFGLLGGFGLVSFIGLGISFIGLGVSFIGGNVCCVDLSLIGLGGHNGDIGLIGLGFALSACWLINFISLGIEGLISKNGFISLGLVGFIGLGLGSLVNGISLIGLFSLIGFIGLISFVSFGLNGLIGKGIIVNSLLFEIEMKQSQHDLFQRESWL
jgi:hypothetical protein